MRCVGVLCGGIPRADLKGAGATEIYDDPADLLASLADSPPLLQAENIWSETVPGTGTGTGTGTVLDTETVPGAHER